MSEEEQMQFDSACVKGTLCNERYCPFVAGETFRLGACEEDWCEQAWCNYCDEKGRRTR